MKQSVKKWFVASAVMAVLLAVPAQASPPGEGGWFGWFSGWVERVGRWVAGRGDSRPASDLEAQTARPGCDCDEKSGPVRDPWGEPSPEGTGEPASPPG